MDPCRMWNHTSSDLSHTRTSCALWDVSDNDGSTLHVHAHVHVKRGNSHVHVGPPHDTSLSQDIRGCKTPIVSRAESLSVLRRAASDCTVRHPGHDQRIVVDCTLIHHGEIQASLRAEERQQVLDECLHDSANEPALAEGFRVHMPERVYSVGPPLDVREIEADDKCGHVLHHLLGSAAGNQEHHVVRHARPRKVAGIRDDRRRHARRRSQERDVRAHAQKASCIRKRAHPQHQCAADDVPLRHMSNAATRACAGTPELESKLLLMFCKRQDVAYRNGRWTPPSMQWSHIVAFLHLALRTLHAPNIPGGKHARRTCITELHKLVDRTHGMGQRFCRAEVPCQTGDDGDRAWRGTRVLAPLCGGVDVGSSDEPCTKLWDLSTDPRVRQLFMSAEARHLPQPQARQPLGHLVTGGPNEPKRVYGACRGEVEACEGHAFLQAGQFHQLSFRPAPACSQS
mmetsp:Transcript_58343/g.160142  ORF Transcript_58343/g.160142 Transcript_58343/m.160142 type:complete len:456 (+) Transcript_58343:22-1389(+)